MPRLVAFRWNLSPAKAKAPTPASTSVTASRPYKDRKKEIGPGLLAKMLRDLEIDPDEL
jgi:hypothetical protein